MRKSIFLSTAILAGAAATAPAMAQDSVNDWSGFYVGGALGAGKTDGGGDETLRFDTDGDGDFDNTVVAGGGDAFSPGYCDSAAAGNSPGDGCDNDGVGTVWSVHAGYDRQFGNLVAGVVLEGGKADVQDSVTGFSTTPASYTLTRDIDWNAAARLRAGLSLGSTLVYGTGGVAYAKVDNSFDTTNTANVFTNNDEAREDMWGYTVGGGVDQKVAENFSIGLLYKYTNYGESDYNVNAGGTVVNPFTSPLTTSGSTDIERSEDFDMHTLQVTTSFRF